MKRQKTLFTLSSLQSCMYKKKAISLENMYLSQINKSGGVNKVEGA